MSKIKIIVSMDIEARATCVVDVEETVRGVHGSPEERAKDYVVACLAMGADVQWKIEHGQIDGVKKRYELTAEREPREFDEVKLAPEFDEGLLTPAAPPPAPDRIRDDEVVF